MKGGRIWRAWALICLAVLLFGAIDQKTRNALKVEHLLKKIETHHSPTDKPTLAAEVTEIELNDYIGYRLARDKRAEVTHLTVHLLDGNQLQGKIVFDAQRMNLGLLFGEALDFDFKGKVYSRRGAARLELGTLLLHGRPVTPRTLDMVLGAIALYNGTEPTRIDDWYALPKGLKRIDVQKGRAELHY
jgi:hypothetical protein